MQILARDGLTDDQVRTLIESSYRDASRFGAEVLDLQGNVVGDLTGIAPGKRSRGIVGGGGDLLGCVITHDATLPAPTNCKIQTTRALDWPNVRIRPWQEISGVRFYLGLYGMETPLQSAAEGVWDVQGYDLLAPLRVAINDTIVVPTTTPYLTAVRDLIDGAGIPGIVHQIASDADAVLPDAPQVFALSTTNTSLLLDCINDLLAAVGYTPLAMNEDGVLVSGPLVDPALRPSELTLDLRDGRASIVDVQRTKKIESLQQYNFWRFVRRRMLAAPTEGAGWYTPRPRPAGRVVPYFESVDVASQDALVAYGDAKVVEHTTRAVTLSLTSDPLPQLGLGVPDIATVYDDDTDIHGRVQIPKWAHDLGQAETTLTAGVL